MEIIKVFSEVDTDEKLYSVLMTEEEVELFSELQKEFARADYAGLTKKGADFLKKERGKTAEWLKGQRSAINKWATSSGNQGQANFMRNEVLATSRGASKYSQNLARKMV